MPTQKNSCSHGNPPNLRWLELISITHVAGLYIDHTNQWRISLVGQANHDKASKLSPFRGGLRSWAMMPRISLVKVGCLDKKNLAYSCPIRIYKLRAMEYLLRVLQRLFQLHLLGPF